MEQKNFTIGNVVKLNSGSPDLTVVAIDESEGTISVKWHTGPPSDNSYNFMVLNKACFTFIRSN